MLDHTHTGPPLAPAPQPPPPSRSCTLLPLLQLLLVAPATPIGQDVLRLLHDSKQVAALVVAEGPSCQCTPFCQSSSAASCATTPGGSAGPGSADKGSSLPGSASEGGAPMLAASAVHVG
jgi:hypothetical protein